MKATTVCRIAVWAAMLVLAVPGARADTPAASDAEFFMLLTVKQVATMADGYRAVAMLARGDNELTDPVACRTLLVERNIARSSWGERLEDPLTKGRLAYMVCRALGVKGGLTMRIFGPSERYCLRECQYLELMASGGCTYQDCRGGELVSVIDRADRYKLEKEGKAQAPAFGAEEPTAPAAQPAAPATEKKSAGSAKPGADADKPATAEPTGDRAGAKPAGDQVGPQVGEVKAEEAKKADTAPTEKPELE